jgi:hypothetical protein
MAPDQLDDLARDIADILWTRLTIKTIPAIDIDGIRTVIAEVGANRDLKLTPRDAKYLETKIIRIICHKVG